MKWQTGFLPAYLVLCPDIGISTIFCFQKYFNLLPEILSLTALSVFTGIIFGSRWFQSKPSRNLAVSRSQVCILRGLECIRCHALSCQGQFRNLSIFCFPKSIGTTFYQTTCLRKNKGQLAQQMKRSDSVFKEMTLLFVYVRTVFTS